MNHRLPLFGATAIAAVLAFSVFALPSAYASGGLAKKNPDFDVTDVDGFTMTVDGTAGGTTPVDQRHVFAYVFVNETCSTDLCAYAVTSHFAEDSGDVEDDIEWHTHYVELTASDAGLCVTHIEDAGALPTFSDGDVTANGASGVVVAGVTAVLNIDKEVGVCVQHIIDAELA